MFTLIRISERCLLFKSTADYNDTIKLTHGATRTSAQIDNNLRYPHDKIMAAAVDDPDEAARMTEVNTRFDGMEALMLALYAGGANLDNTEFAEALSVAVDAIVG